jgi:DNA-binding transcriptional MerR regulator
MEILLSPADASRILGLTPQGVRWMERRGALKVVARTEGGIRLFRRADVERLAADRRSRRTESSAPEECVDL